MIFSFSFVWWWCVIELEHNTRVVVVVVSLDEDDDDFVDEFWCFLLFVCGLTPPSLYGYATIIVRRRSQVCAIRPVYCRRTQSMTFVTAACWATSVCAAPRPALCYCDRRPRHPVHHNVRPSPAGMRLPHGSIHVSVFLFFFGVGEGLGSSGGRERGWFVCGKNIARFFCKDWRRTQTDRTKQTKDFEIGDVFL